MSLKVFTVLLVAIHASGGVSAHEQEIIFNQVRLEAQAERDVENDQLQILLEAEEQGNEPDQIAGKVNEKMQWALQLAKEHGDIEVSTKSYQTFPIYKDQLVVAWRASQQLQLRSTRIAEVSALAGQLQERLQIQQMVFTPTAAARAKTENILIEEAMEAFKRRVDVVAKHMDQKSYRIVELNVGTGGYQPPMMFAERAMMKSMDAAPAPAVEAGTSKITITVTGAVQFY